MDNSTIKTVSLMLLTYNRKEVTIESIRHNLRNAGYPIAEIIWVDNNSTDGLREMILNEINPDVSVFHKTNLGVAKGYNAGYKLCRGYFVARPGTDMIMPDNWLRHMVRYASGINETGVCAIKWNHPEVIERLTFGIKKSMASQYRMLEHADHNYSNDNYLTR